MIKALLANTVEADDTDKALRDILAQLNIGKNLRRSSVGLVHCCQAFVESGAVKAVCDRLPFPTVGINTLLNSSSLGLLDNMLMTVCVLTSDEVRFAVGLSDPVQGDCMQPLTKMYVEAESLLAKRPSFRRLFCGLWGLDAVGEEALACLDSFSDQVPIFGTLPGNYGTELKDPRIIYNGQDYMDRAAVILVEGQVTPAFNVCWVPIWRGIQQRAIVTESEGNLIREVNGLPALEFLDTLGLSWYGQLSGQDTIPVFLDRNDGRPPVVRSIYKQTSDGSILLSGAAPVDSTMGFGILDEQTVLKTAQEMAHSVQQPYSSIFMVYSCLSRNFALGLDYLSEMERFHSTAPRQLPYIFSYSAGEFCPLPNPDGTLRNEFHNMSIIGVTF
jgi:hypothetical protein